MKAALAGAVERGRLPPALLLTGLEGVGKRTLALAVGRARLCEQPVHGEACGTCPTCRRLGRGAAALDERRAEARQHPDDPLGFNFRLHPDLFLTEPARPRARPEIRVDQVRVLVREIEGRPFEARARFFVIDEADTMNEQAQNALLKSLEEPPPTSHLALVSSAPHVLLPTIRSRCQELRLGPLPRALVEGFLIEHGGVAADEARLRAALADGSPGRALALEAETYRALREALLGLLEETAAGRPDHERLAAAGRLADEDDLPAALVVLRSLLRDVAALHVGGASAGLLNADVASRLRTLAAGPLGPRAVGLARDAAQSRVAVRGYAHKLLTIDVLLDRLAGDPS